MPSIKQLEKNLGVSFKNKQLLTQALTHRSFLNEHPEMKESNERLEFLGDALLEAWVSERLFKKFPHFPEGVLTDLRASLVRTESLAHLATQLKLGNSLLLSKGEESGGGRQNQGLLADCFEALIGAIFCDQGKSAVNKFLDQTILPKIRRVSAADLKDPKSLLQEIAQAKFRITPDYRILKSKGPDHAKIFWAGVFLDQKKIGSGKGNSKQQAETNAAKDALEKIKQK